MLNFKPITSRKIRFALVGGGRISAKHFEASQKHAADVELVAVCDIDAKALGAGVNVKKTILATASWSGVPSHVRQ